MIDDDNMLLCTKCKSKYHYRCTALPAYQIAMFLTSRYRKFECEKCVDVSDTLLDKCRRDDSSLQITEDDSCNEIKLSDMLKKELYKGKEVIKSTEMACATLRELVSDKDSIIAQQKSIIESCRSITEENDMEMLKLREKLENTNFLVDERSIELSETRDALEKKNKNSHTECNCKINELLQKNEILKKELEAQVNVTKMTELAFSTQSELVKTKEELIRNQNALIENMETINNNVNEANTVVPQITTFSVPGLQECVLSLNNIALHGVVFNGFLVWADTQRKTIPQDIWKEKALKHFTSEEITDAKNMLWEVAKHDIIGKKINRKGESKSSSEVDDICYALSRLSESDVLPLFISTSNMVTQTPFVATSGQISNIGTLEIKMESLEVTLDKFMTKQCELLSKSTDRVISKSDLGNKKIDEVMRRLKYIEEKSALPVTNLNHDNGVTQNCPPQMEVGGYGISHNNTTIEASHIEMLRSNEVNQQDWSTVGRRGTRIAVDGNLNRAVYGTAHDQNNGMTLAADIILVAYGVAKNVTAIQLAEFLETKGLKVVDCQLLTTYEKSRSLSYKVTIKASDYDKSRDPATWPYRVSVRPFKHRRENAINQNNLQNKVGGQIYHNSSTQNNRQNKKIGDYNRRNYQNGIEFHGKSLKFGNDRNVWLLPPSKAT